MARSFVFLFVLLMAAGRAAFAQDAKARENVFADQKCSLCHSVAGKGAKSMTAKTGPTRKPEMKAYTLAKGDVDPLVAYLATLKRQ